MNWNWIAGFMEGEGHIYWQEGKSGTKQGVGGKIIIGQKCKEPLNAIKRFLLEENFENPRLYLRPKSNITERSTEIWILELARRKDVIRFLEAINKKLFQKRDKADFVLNRLKNLEEERHIILEKATKLRQDGATWREIIQETGIGRTALMNYFKAEGIEIKYEKRDTTISWRRWRIEHGLCSTCGKPIDEDGTKWRCSICAEKYREYSRKRRERLKQAGLCRDCGKSRGKDGTETMCRSCSDKRSMKRWIAKTKARREEGQPQD